MFADVILELMTFVFVVLVLPSAFAALWCFLVDPLDWW